MSITKERLLEIEQELNGLTIQKMTQRDSLSAVANREHECPHCNRISKGSSFQQHHFDNCKLKGINLEEFNKELLTMSIGEICSKYNIDVQFISNYRRYFGILANKNIEHKCPHCNRSGNGNRFIREHFDNCKLKGVNLEEFNKDLLNKTTNLNKIANKYNLERGYVERHLHRLKVNNS